MLTNHENYTYEATDIVKVPSYRDTEPSLFTLFDVRYVKKQRELEYDRDNLSQDQVDDYLQTISDELRLRALSIKSQLYEIGKLIYDAKQLLPHGEFKPWLEANVEFSYSTAINCMRVYRACMGTPELVEYYPASALYVICCPKFPKDLRKNLFENTEGFVDVNKKELLQVAMKWKKGEVSIKSEEVQNLLRTQKTQSIVKKYEVELMAVQKLLQDRFQRIKNEYCRYETHPLVITSGEDTFNEAELREDIFEMLHGFISKITVQIGKMQKL